MREDATALQLPALLLHRATLGQLLRFGVVGVSGYVVNLVTFWLVLRATGSYELGAVAAFGLGVSNNFLWNRHWTFSAADGHAGRQALRFLLVSLLSFAANFGVLELLVRAGGVAELPAQAVAVLAATPFSFLANKLWSFAA